VGEEKEGWVGREVAADRVGEVQRAEWGRGWRGGSVAEVGEEEDEG
jgi:hypothetical protein